MGEDDHWLSLQGFEVAAREPVPFFRRREQLFDLIGERRRIDANRTTFPAHRFVDPDDQAGQRVQPCEPGIVDHELQEVADRTDAASVHLIRRPRIVEQHFVQVQELAAELDQLAAQVAVLGRRGGTCR